MATAKVHAHWYVQDGLIEIWLVGKYLYYYSWEDLPNFKLGQVVSKEEIGHPIKWLPWNPKYIPIQAYRALN
ncbi:hypothetical protein GPK34_06985 [Secundilactobacillus kimchicus]|uniref:hypothetical protein n=1 Tax=Secundilactobacillus kimchicus TaxID=528209 RepID=UPI001C00D82E|nr:hypothetical protein [Secundilactobacillus kimchicus]MBT9671774.1 hypothetical protein [Secundilactobacillus kimchicus]